MATKQRLQVHIDWTELTLDQPDTTVCNVSSGRVDSLLKWIESCPNRTDVEVHLNTGRKSEPCRRLQRSLQTLGCTVIARYFMPTMA